jgi:hypothetical protein
MSDSSGGKSRQISRKCGAIVAAAALAMLAGQPAQAQFGFNLGSLKPKASQADTTTNSGCPKGRSKSAGSSIMGGIIGSAAGSAMGRTGFGQFMPSSLFTDTITNAIACRLDPKEQKQAAEATVEATRGDAKVGSTATWTSGTRKDVTGKSTVIARNDDVAGAQCITVSDVVIVNGEETNANKRMCKKPGSARYALVA